MNNTKKKYVTPVFDVIEFCNKDVVTLSGGLETTGKFTPGTNGNNINEIKINF